MTAQLLKSQIDRLGFDFAAAIDRYIQERIAFRTSGGFPPTAHYLVESAIRRIQHPIDAGLPDDYVPDYEIVDDTPPPPTPQERRALAVIDSRVREAAEIDALLAPGKRRLLEMNANAALRLPEDKRSNDHLVAIAQFADLTQRIEEVQYQAALREAAIDDMQ